MRIFTTLFCMLMLFNSALAQELDSTKIESKDYPYVLPLLGQKAYDRGITLPLPFSASIGTIFNKQGIVLNNFSMAFTEGIEEPDFDELQPISDLVVFGPSEGRINTLFARVEAWVLPFLSVGAYYGKVWGEQTITLTSPIDISSTTDINGEYYGINLVGVAPLGPVLLQADYSWSWTTNERLDTPVEVRVSGIRLMKRFVNKKDPSKFWAVWGGAQFQNLASQTSGKIGLGEALNIGPDYLNELDARWEVFKTTDEWNSLNPIQKGLAESAFQRIRDGVENLGGTTVHYKFDKRLEFEWNMVLGGTYVFDKHWAIRGEYGFLKSKQSLMFQVAYNFGL